MSENPNSTIGLISMRCAFVPSITCLSPMSKPFFGTRMSTSISTAFKRPKQTLQFLTAQNTPRLSLPSFIPHSIPFFSLQSNDVSLTGALLATAFLWLVLWQRLTSLKLVSSSVTRKIIHISCGPLFVASWPLYSDATSARWLAAVVPLCFISLLTLSGHAREDQTRRASLGRAISREGKAADALEGPLYYAIVLMLISLLLFKSPISVIVVAQLCFGDGAAEIIGKRYGANSQWGLPWTGDKSIAGSTAFVFAALVASCAGLTWWNYWNLAHMPVTSLDTFISLAAISTACAATELTPKELAGDDNFTVAVAAVAMSVVLFGWRLV